MAQYASINMGQFIGMDSINMGSIKFWGSDFASPWPCFSQIIGVNNCSQIQCRVKSGNVPCTVVGTSRINSLNNQEESALLDSSGVKCRCTFAHVSRVRGKLLGHLLWPGPVLLLLSFNPSFQVYLRPNSHTSLIRNSISYSTSHSHWP